MPRRKGFTHGSGFAYGKLDPVKTGALGRGTRKVRNPRAKPKAVPKWPDKQFQRGVAKP